MTQDIEQLAIDIISDIRARDLKEVVIESEGRPYSISVVEFECLKSRLAEVAPEVRVLYKRST